MFPKAKTTQNEEARTYGVKYINKELELVLDMEKCAACGICVDACPKEALEISPRSESKLAKSHYIPKVPDPKACSYCGLCQIMCPFEALQLKVDGEAVPTEELEIVTKRAMPTILSEKVDCPNHGHPAQSYFKGSITLATDSDFKGFKICADMCPTEALTWNNDALKLDDEKCIYCGACSLSAPKEGVIDLKRDKIKFKGAFNKELWLPLSKRLLD